MASGANLQVYEAIKSNIRINQKLSMVGPRGSLRFNYNGWPLGFRNGRKVLFLPGLSFPSPHCFGHGVGTHHLDPFQLEGNSSRMFEWVGGVGITYLQIQM